MQQLRTMRSTSIWYARWTAHRKQSVQDLGVVKLGVEHDDREGERVGNVGGPPVDSAMIALAIFITSSSKSQKPSKIQFQKPRCPCLSAERATENENKERPQSALAVLQNCRIAQYNSAKFVQNFHENCCFFKLIFA